MPIGEQNSLTVEELKDIIHVLKMETFTGLEEGASTEIRAMIDALPAREQMDRILTTPNAVSHLQKDVGNIMRLIELYSKRDLEYKTRYKSRTGLPPRYKVLDWRKPMATASRMQLKSDIVKELVKLSADLDAEGYSDLSQRFIDCAKCVQNNAVPVEYLYNATKDFIKASLSKGMIKEAQALTDLNYDFSDITNGLQNVGAWFDKIEQSFQQKFQYLQKHPKTQQFVAPLQNIWKSISQLAQTTKAQATQVDQATKDISNQMDKSLTPQSIQVGGKPMQIQWEDDPTDPGYQRAVVTVGNKKYEVQEDESGKRSLKEIPAQEQAQPAPAEQPAQQPESDTSAQAQQPVAQAPTQTTQTGEGQGATTTTMPDVSKMNINTIDAILKYLNVAAKVQGKIYTQSMALAIDQNTKFQIDQLKQNPAELQKFIEQLKAQKAKLGTAQAPAPDQANATVQPQADVQPNATTPAPVQPQAETQGENFPVTEIKPSSDAQAPAQKPQGYASDDTKTLQNYKKQTEKLLATEKAKSGFRQDRMKIRQYQETLQKINEELSKRSDNVPTGEVSQEKTAPQTEQNVTSSFNLRLYKIANKK